MIRYKYITIKEDIGKECGLKQVYTVYCKKTDELIAVMTYDNFWHKYYIHSTHSSDLAFNPPWDSDVSDFRCFLSKCLFTEILDKIDMEKSEIQVGDTVLYLGLQGSDHFKRGIVIDQCNQDRWPGHWYVNIGKGKPNVLMVNESKLKVIKS